MTTDHYKLGPGKLTLGTDPDDAEFNMQLSKCLVEPAENVEAGDTFDLLDGSELKDDGNVTYTYELQGTAVQDLVDTGFTAYCWANKGDEVAFEFVPVTARVAKVTGHCRIRPIRIGGDVKVRNTADFVFVCTGDDPVFVPEDSTP